MRRFSGFALLLLLVACGAGERRIAEPIATAPADWRTIATAEDRARLRGWREDWTAALARARAAGKGAEIAALGPLLAPDAGQAGPPPPGEYRCRTVKLGAKRPGLPELTAYPPFRCRIAREGDLLSFAKLDGSQRPVGLLFPHGGGAKLVFLGTMLLADEARAQDYGRDPERDMIGALERIGPARWRLVLPSPRWESMIDIVELVPA